MMSWFNREAGVIFIAVPKTASTSIASAPFLQHAGHQTILEFREQEGFEDAFKFAFTRNPWDRFISAWRGHRPSTWSNFDAAIQSSEVHFRPVTDFICDSSGVILVDFIGRYENLEDDWEWVCNMIGIKPYILEHKRVTPNRRPYQEYYTSPDMIEAVRNKYRKDIELFNYSY